MNFAHTGTSKTEYDQTSVSIAECMEEARTPVSLDKKSKDINIELHCDPRARIQGDAQRLLQVLVNLINNARDASQPNSTIQMRAVIEGDVVRLSVTDEGIGIPAAIKDRIFDLFFTTKEAGEGTGLGLSWYLA